MNLLPSGCAVSIAALIVALGSARAAECAASNAPDGPEPAELGVVAYPTAALLDGAEGRGVAQVTVGRDGKVSNGVIVTDQPAGYRFGQAVLNALLMESRFRRNKPGNYQYCFDFRSAESGEAEDLAELEDAPTIGGGPILGIHSPTALEAQKDGTASVVVKIDNAGEVTEILAVEAEPAGLQLERAAAVTVGATQFERSRSGRYRARVIFSYAALKTAFDAGKPFSLPGPFVPKPDPDHFPTRAARSGAQGVVELSLEVGVNGLLKRIAIERETPKGLGMGLVALFYGNKIIFHPATGPGSYPFTLNFLQRFK